MEFKINKSAFEKVIQKTQTVIERKNTTPLLENVKLDAAGNRLEINATDMTVAIRDAVEAEVTEPGSITVSAKKLFEIVKELPEDEVNFRLESNNWISISSGMARFKLVGTPDDEFPLLPEFQGIEMLKIPSDILDTLTKKTVYAVSHDENRQILNGILFSVKPEKIVMVATDGHRLALVEYENTVGLSELEVVVPAKGVHEIRRMVGSGAEEILFGRKNNHLVFNIDEEYVITNLVHGTFPNYSMVIPTEFESEVKLNVEQFMHSLRRVALFSDVTVRGVKLNFYGDLLTITSRTPEYGEAKDEIPVQFSGEPIQIGFNVTYLLDLLRTVDTETITMKINDVTGPVLFEPGETQNYKYLSVIMPMIV